LYYISRAVVLAEIARTRFNVEPTIVLRQQAIVRKEQVSVVGKGLETERVLKRCFPWFRSLSFNFGNSEVYSKVKSLQTKVVSQMESARNHSMNWMTTIKGLDDNNMQVVWESMKGVADIASTMNSISTSLLPASLFAANKQPNVSMPMVDVTTFFPHFIMFQEPIRRAYVFDDEGCCGVLPDADETVFVSITGSPCSILLKMAKRTCCALTMCLSAFRTDTTMNSTTGTFWASCMRKGRI
jgi:hypothetical protein